MLEILIFFIGASLLLYVLFGGADYGAGVLEFFKGRRRAEDQQELINRVIGPVWEANHIWLILVIVILFTGFPRVYTTVSTYLHIPLVALLLGIIARGCAFSFRHYDAIKDGSQRVYSIIFSASSVWSAIWLGVIAGALIWGRISPEADTYFALFISPWFNLFSFLVGLFAVSLFTFLAAIYLLGETSDRELQDIFLRKAKLANIAAVLLGAAVFLLGSASDARLGQRFFSNPYCLLCMVGATILLPAFYSSSVREFRWVLRGCAALQVSFILVGWYLLEYPYLLRTVERAYTFEDLAAPAAVQWQLVIALLVGSALIFPALAFLYRVMDNGADLRPPK